MGRPLLIVGDGAASNLVLALKGETPFGVDLDDPPPGAALSRMPAQMDPVVPESIAFIQAWMPWRASNAVPSSRPPTAAAAGRASRSPTRRAT